MKFGNLKTLARAYIPGAKSSAVTPATMDIVLNEGALDVAFRLKCLKAFDYFDSVANAESYDLSEIFDDFLAVDDPGVWWLSGTQYQEIFPHTIKSMDNKFKNWRGDSSSEPERYIIHGNNLFIPHPIVTADTSDAFLIYYAKRPAVMTSDEHFPFPIDGNQSNERSDLAILSDCILLYAEWKILKILSERQDAYEKKNEYLEDLVMKGQLLGLRPDISSHDLTKFSGPKIG